MKTLIKKLWSLMPQVIAGTTVVAVLAIGVSTAGATSPSPQITYTWAFPTSGNPSAPSSSTGGGGAASASVATGAFSQGWLSGNAAFGSASGIWDLGQNGTLTLAAPSGFTGAGSPAATLSVKVVQWNDGGIFSAFAGVSVPNATLVKTNLTTLTDISPSDGIGVWIQEETVWNVSSSTPVNSVVVTSANPDSVVDSVAIESTFTVPPLPPILAITPVGPGNQVKISWSTNYSSMSLESNSDVANSQDWNAVETAPQIDASGNYVILSATNAMQFYRLKQN